LNKKQEKAHGNDEVNDKFRNGIVFDYGDVILKYVYGVFGAGPGDYQTHHGHDKGGESIDARAKLRPHSVYRQVQSYMFIFFQDVGGGKKGDEQQCVFGAFENPLERIIDRIAQDHVQGYGNGHQNKNSRRQIA
jgi:hypothetical protein